MAELINDNGVVGFTRVVALTLPLGGGALNLVLYDFKIDTGVNAEFEVTNNVSKTTGYMAQRGVNKGTATAQFQTAGFDQNTLWGATFTSETVPYVIIGVGRAETKDGETTLPITFRQTVGTVVVT
jgi:hypothetical protein